MSLNGTFRCHYSTHYVNLIDSCLIGGRWHKVWHLQLHSSFSSIGSRSYSIIEGIGSTGGPDFPVCPASFEFSTFLICFNNNNIAPLVTPPVEAYFDNLGSCTSDVRLGDANTLKKEAEISIYPNPIVPVSKIVFPLKINTGHLRIYSYLGLIIYDAVINNAQEILIGNKIHHQGIYIYQVTNLETGVKYEGKFVFE